jgi:hypothetical protein
MTASASVKLTAEWKTQVLALNLSQPDPHTCQAACIGMAVRDPSVIDVRRKLDKLPGGAGAPANMGTVLKSYLGKRYSYNGAASLNDMIQYLKGGELLITHGWFTGSGHVIALDGLKDPTNGSYLFNVKDPWSEFDGPSWRYNSPGVHFYDGFYSVNIIYAACVVGVSAGDAAAHYRDDPDYTRKSAWVHRIMP